MLFAIEAVAQQARAGKPKKNGTHHRQSDPNWYKSFLQATTPKATAVPLLSVLTQDYDKHVLFTPHPTSSPTITPTSLPTAVPTSVPSVNKLLFLKQQEKQLQQRLQREQKRLRTLAPTPEATFSIETGDEIKRVQFYMLQLKRRMKWGELDHAQMQAARKKMVWYKKQFRLDVVGLAPPPPTPPPPTPKHRTFHDVFGVDEAAPAPTVSAPEPNVSTSVGWLTPEHGNQTHGKWRLRARPAQHENTGGAAPAPAAHPAKTKLQRLQREEEQLLKLKLKRLKDQRAKATPSPTLSPTPWAFSADKHVAHYEKKYDALDPAQLERQIAELSAGPGPAPGPA
jgi:hypothetical protein